MKSCRSFYNCTMCSEEATDDPRNRSCGERNVANCVTQTRSSENGVTDYYPVEVSWVSREMNSSPVGLCQLVTDDRDRCR